MNDNDRIIIEIPQIFSPQKIFPLNKTGFWLF